MPRCGRIRTYLKEYSESPRLEKISFIPPFLVLIVEIILIEHALRINEGYIIALTIVLLILSAIEILLVAEEIHDHYQRTNYDRILTIRLDDFVLKTKKINVKVIVEKFIEIYPKYATHRNEIYHIVCQIMETHEEEAWEKDLTNKLEKFIKKRKKMNVEEIMHAFLKKYPTYKKHPGKVYTMTCQILGVPEDNKVNE